MRIVACLTATILSFSVSAADTSLDAYLLGTSVHFRNASYDDSFNANNIGAGVGITVFPENSSTSPRLGLTSLLLSYNDSYHQSAIAVGVGPIVRWGRDDGWHADAMLPIGYLDGSGWCGAAAMPMAAVGFGRLSLCAALSPPLGDAAEGPDDNVTAIGFFLRFCQEIP